MSDARFWFVPLKDVAPEALRLDLARRDEVTAADLPPSYGVPSKLIGEGIGTGDVLALHDGEQVVALARLLALDSSTLHWRRLPLAAAVELPAAPALREVEPHEHDKFRLGIEAILRDAPVAGALPAERLPPQRTYRPTTPTSNILLYGPPGTGKTYSVRSRALELIGAQSAPAATSKEQQAEWDELCRSGRIVFCTFHQAFAYEEFVEGLRARTDGAGNVEYSVAPGIFKQLALVAAGAGVTPPRQQDLDFDARWRLLVAALGSEEERIVKGKNGGEYKLSTSARDNLRATRVEQNANGDLEEKTGPLIASRQTLAKLWADRSSLGDDPSTTDLAKRFGGGATAVWIAYQELQKVTVPDSTQASLERARRALATGEAFVFDSGCPQYVLVIDEINRANIARVFGELITLLEPDKRLGRENELRVQLPASKEWFGVPPNLHVIGTMNTADRSIALMDVALRRRFDFEEMMPDASKIRAVLADARDPQGAPARVPTALVDLVVDVFEKLNARLRYLYDREHQIGHAYFLRVRTLRDLRDVFATKVIPLLQEYFFGHWEKLAIVVGHPTKGDGTPKPSESDDEPTVLRAHPVEEMTVIGFNHEDYENGLEWSVSADFAPVWKPDAHALEPAELRIATTLYALLRDKQDASERARALVDALKKPASV